MDFVTKTPASRWHLGALLLAASTCGCSSGPSPIDVDLQQCTAQWSKITPLLQQVFNVAKNPRPPQADLDAAVNASDKFTAEIAKVKPKTPEVQKLQAELVTIDKASGDALVEWATNLHVYEKSTQEASIAQDYFGRQGYT